MLFFETQTQAYLFLASIPLGFLLMLILALRIRYAAIRTPFDFVAIIGAALILSMFIAKNREGGMRMYHLLGVLCGVYLYSVLFSRRLTGGEKKE